MAGRNEATEPQSCREGSSSTEAQWQRESYRAIEPQSNIATKPECNIERECVLQRGPIYLTLTKGDRVSTD